VEPSDKSSESSVDKAAAANLPELSITSAVPTLSPYSITNLFVVAMKFSYYMWVFYKLYGYLYFLRFPKPLNGKLYQLFYTTIGTFLNLNTVELVLAGVTRSLRLPALMSTVNVARGFEPVCISPY